MKFIYNTSIHLYFLFIWLASFFNKKAKQWIEGRKNVFENIRSKINKNDHVIWFHCASLGEFEQGRPLIEKYKIENLKCKVLLTFFSPSGYEVRKNYDGADYVFYLPLDTHNNAKEFISVVNPKMAFFIKYEFWYNYLSELKNKKVPTYLVSAIFRKNQPFFQWYGLWFKKQLSNFTFFFLQDDNSKKLLHSIGYTNCSVTGDTRFDRVHAIAANSKKIDLIEKFKANKKLIVAGSTWREDEEIVENANIKGLVLIVVPHEVDEATIQTTENIFKKSKTILFSKATGQNISNHDVLIIDNVGMLSSIYKYADIAYIGGGFGKGIHNILEAAVFGIPIVFGPNYQKFTEAKRLIELKGAFSIRSKQELEQLISTLLFDEQENKKSGGINKGYVASSRGATEKIMNTIRQL